MDVVWTREAINDLDEIQDHIALDSPVTAYRFVNDVKVRTDAILGEHPMIGRVGRVSGTREWVVPKSDYIVAYAWAFVSKFSRLSTVHKNGRHISIYSWSFRYYSAPTAGIPCRMKPTKRTRTVAINGPNSVDVHVGTKARIRRKSLGLSQSALAASIGLTFQQVQKYERGSNRISASKLYEIAQVLKVPISYFFDGLEGEGADAGVSTHHTKQVQHRFLMTTQGLELARAFGRLKNESVRLRILALIVALAEGA